MDLLIKDSFPRLALKGPAERADRWVGTLLTLHDDWSIDYKTAGSGPAFKAGRRRGTATGGDALQAVGRLIAVSDVQATSRWYQRLLGCRSDHGGDEYERLISGNGTLILQLHSFSVDHHHGPIADSEDRPYGNGVLLWFEVDDFEAAVARTTELKAEVVIARHRNPRPNHWEIWLRDPDGYTVVLASPDGTARRGWMDGSAD